MSNSIRKVGVLDFAASGVKPFTTVSASDQIEPYHTNRTFEAYGTTASGSGAATILIEVRNSELATWKTMATVSLTLGTTSTGDGFASSAAWRYVRARISAISGTGASVNINMGTAPL